MLLAALRRGLNALASLALVTVVVFGLIHLAPGEGVGDSQTDDGMRPMSPEARQELRRIYRLDRPVPVQYTLWIRDVCRGDLGRSFIDRRPVSEKITERLGVTSALNGLALALMLLVSVPLGAAAALRPGSAWDRFGAYGSYALYSVPVFWAGLMLQILLSVKLGWLPLAGTRSLDSEMLGLMSGLADRAAHLTLPVICLAYGGVAYLSRFVRATLIENASADSWRAARARGLSLVSVLYRHGFRQAGVPMLTLAGLLLPGLVSGSVIVETIFAIPGLGRLFVDAAFQRDIPVLMGLTLLSAGATLAGIVAADLAYAWVDPRFRKV